MAIHSTILAWKIPRRTEEPGRLQSIGSHDRHDRRDIAFILCYGATQVALVVKKCLPVQEIRDMDLIPGSGRSPGEGNGNPLHYSCLGKPMDRGAGGLQSVGLQRVGHDLATKQQQLQLPKACDISFSNHMYQCESLMCT